MEIFRDKRGWLALIIFMITCYAIGVNRYLMKNLNATILAMLAISIGLVVLLDYNHKEEKKEEIE